MDKQPDSIVEAAVEIQRLRYQPGHEDEIRCRIASSPPAEAAYLVRAGLLRQNYDPKTETWREGKKSPLEPILYRNLKLAARCLWKQPSIEMLTFVCLLFGHCQRQPPLMPPFVMF